MKRKLLKLIGHKHGNRFSWGEFYWHFPPSKWNLSLKLTQQHTDFNDMLVFSPFIFSAYVFLPSEICRDKNSMLPLNGKSYGFYVYESLKKFHSLVLLWRKNSKHIEMPWTYKWYSVEVLDHEFNSVYYEDLNMRKHNSSINLWEKRSAAGVAHEKIYDYTYVRKNGEIQSRKATVIVHRTVWVMRGFPLKKKTETSIYVSFDKEIGESVYEYNGGVVGCSCTIKNGETPEMTLRRMEQEQKFD